MRVHVVAFATAAQALGTARREEQLPEASTARDLLAVLEANHPAFAGRSVALAIAVDGELVAPHTVLTDGCEVALLPPVSGG